MSRCWIVYDIIESGVLVYVGHTFRPGPRFRYHRRTGTAGPSAVMVTVSEHSSRIEAADAERERIMNKCPTKNIQHNIRMTHLPPPKPTPPRTVRAAHIRAKRNRRKVVAMEAAYVEWLKDNPDRLC